MALASARNNFHKLTAGALIGALGFALLIASTLSAAAQTSDGRVQVAQGFFDRLFGPLPGGGGPMFGPEPPKPVDSSRAPPPRKPDTPPTITVLVMGDSLADWLAYGLEEALVDSPEYGIIRKARVGSGLIRYDLRNESLEWAQAAREMLASEKPNYIVMMIGLNDRQAIRVQPGRSRPQAVEKPPGAEPDQENPDQPQVAAPERPRTPGVYDFHSDKWEEVYTKRIDDTIAVLKSKGVPVFWVGLPSLRTQKATSEASYLNELFRARAEKAGIVYVDVWDGFVDEKGAFMLQGPDYEGQNRRLRANDGIHFTRPGARKLAHYLEKEISRVNPLQPEPVALPGAEPLQRQAAPTDRPGASGLIARPLTGPVVPLSVFAYARTAEELVGSAASLRRGEEPTTQAAAQALAKGDILPIPAGRSDDFAWPRRGIAAVGSDPAVTQTTMPVPVAQLPPPPPGAEPAARTAARATGGGALAPQQRVFQAPAPQRPSFNPFSFFPFFR